MNTEPLSRDELAYANDAHYLSQWGHMCWECNAFWPCTASRLLATIERDHELLRELVDPDVADLGDCPYLARWRGTPGSDPEATCAYGCADEPECMTCEPEDGWPRERARQVLGIEATDDRIKEH